MKISVRADSVEISGYVNAVERNSKPLMSRIGQFIERICKGAFKKALKRNDDVHILLNHDWTRDLGSTKAGNLELKEDNIGLFARACITDKDVIEKARAGKLVGWSFGFTDRDVTNLLEKGMPTREVKDLDLYEVSILDNTKVPAYEGTLISARAETDEVHFRGDNFIDEVSLSIEDEEEPKIEPEQDANDNENASKEKEEASVQVTEEDEVRSEQQENLVDNIENQVEQKPIDYSKYENLIKEMKGD